MKLLTRTTVYYIVFSLAAFIIGGFVFSHFLFKIFNNEINANLERELKLIEETMEHSDTVPDFRSVYGHFVDIRKSDSFAGNQIVWHDTVIYDVASGKFRLFRHLFAERYRVKNNVYSISILKSLDEKNIITESIIFAMGILFLTLVVLLAFLNYFVLRGTWIPFYRIISAIDKYDIQSEEPLKLSRTSIREFRLLQSVLEKMSVKIRQDYITLKEFNENASHELQTPLAVIKTKLDLLIQSESLTGEQLRLIQSVYEATNRMARLNQGLLLISRIENNQITKVEEVSINDVVKKTLENLQELIQYRGIRVTTDLQGEKTLKMNRDLAYIMVSNLMSNAVRHNIQKGTLEILLREESLEITNTGKELKSDPSLLFERFRKSDAKGESLGLGLAITKKIAGFYGMNLEYRYHDALHTLVLSFT
jgi:signal transduction histidine kinase